MAQTTAGPCGRIRLFARERILAAVRNLIALDTTAATDSLRALDLLSAIHNVSALDNLSALRNLSRAGDNNIRALADLAAIHTFQLLRRRPCLLRVTECFLPMYRADDWIPTHCSLCLFHPNMA